MKTKNLGIAILLIAAAAIIGCSRSGRQVNDTEKNAESARKTRDDANKQYLEDIREFRKETAAMVEANTRSIAELNKAAEGKTDDVKAAYRKQVNGLEQKNKELKTKIDSYVENGQDNWEVFKSEFSRDMQSLGQSLKDFSVRNR